MKRSEAAQECVGKICEILRGISQSEIDNVQEIVSTAMKAQEKLLIRTLKSLHNDHHDAWRTECHEECWIAALLRDYDES